MIKDALSAAMQRKPNTYELIHSDRTTGLHTIGSDINAYNSHGMTPTQVALQAGAEDELNEILAQPECDPLQLSNAGQNTFLFAAIYLDSHDAPNPLTHGNKKATSAQGLEAQRKADRMWDAVLTAAGQKTAPAHEQRRDHV